MKRLAALMMCLVLAFGAHAETDLAGALSESAVPLVEILCMCTEISAFDEAPDALLACQAIRAYRTVFDEAGKRMKSSATLELVRDTRDRQFLATRGFRASVAGSLAGGPLGAETDHYGFSAAYSQYVPLWFGHVFNLRGGARMVKEFGDSETVPIFDRMFLGGPMSVRAIKNRKLGPRDEENDARGGRSSANVTAEYTFPIFPIVRGCFFYDGGIVWQGLFAEEVNEKVPVIGDGEWGDGAGLGLRLDIPGFPFQLDYAWPIHHDEGLPDTGRFSFNIGYNF